MNRTIIRNAVAGTTLVATAALAAPAYACLPSETGSAPASTTFTAQQASWAASNVKTEAKDPKSAAPTFAQVQAKVLKRLDAKLAALKAWRSKVATSDRLTSTQRATWLGKIDTASAALSQLRSQVAADTTTDQVKADLVAFKAAHRDDLSGLAVLWQHRSSRDPKSRDARRGDCDGVPGQDAARYDGRRRSGSGWAEHGSDARTAPFHHDGASRAGLRG